ncbi:unnamed protein product [Dicrocoelium dendriticum]|nr:unnamed protein product [Dicrocoelium dendriticum]
MVCYCPPQAKQPLVKLVQTRQNPSASGRGRRCVFYYGHKTYIKRSRTSKTACDGRQADPYLSLQSHSRAGSAHHCLVGQIIEPKAPGGVPQANLQITHCLVGQAIESNAPSGVPQANLRSTTTTSRAIAHQCNRMPARKAFSIGCWNVHTLLDRNSSERLERRTALVAMELARYHIDIAALSETRLAKQSKLHEAGAGYTFYWVGNAASAPREHGVGFAISDRLNGQLVGEPTGISARLMTIRLRIGRRDNFGIYIRSALSFRPVQRSLPSTAFLLPDPRLFLATEPLVITPHVNYSAHDYEEFFRDINYTLGYDMMQSTKPSLDSFVGPTGIDEVFCIHGSSVPTTYHMVYSEPTFYRSGFPDQYPTLIPGDGDGTVHMRSLELCQNWPGTKHVVFEGAEHLQIVADPRLIDLVVKIIGANLTELEV